MRAVSLIQYFTLLHLVFMKFSKILKKLSVAASIMSGTQMTTIKSEENETMQISLQFAVYSDTSSA